MKRHVHFALGYFHCVDWGSAADLSVVYTASETSAILSSFTRCKHDRGDQH
jgi:hypothetical protein